MPPPVVPIQLGLLLRQSHSRAATTVNKALAPLGLTTKHFGVLLLIDRDGVSTQRDLIAETGSDKAGMVRTVEDLERLGYLGRTRSRTDKRVTELRLTAAGEKAFATARGVAGKTVRELFGMFSPAELETLEELLSRFVEAGRE